MLHFKLLLDAVSWMSKVRQPTDGDSATRLCRVVGELTVRCMVDMELGIPLHSIYALFFLVALHVHMRCGMAFAVSQGCVIEFL